MEEDIKISNLLYLHTRFIRIRLDLKKNLNEKWIKTIHKDIIFVLS